jgi:hypothetical protein
VPRGTLGSAGCSMPHGSFWETNEKQMKNEIKTTESDEAKKPTKLMKVMFTPEEQACIKLVANLKNIPANEYMRKIVVAQAKKDMKTTNDKINKMADSI